MGFQQNDLTQSSVRPYWSNYIKTTYLFPTKRLNPVVGNTPVVWYPNVIYEFPTKRLNPVVGKD